MIDLEFVQQLIRTLDESSLDNVEIERGGTRIRLSKTPPPAGAPVALAPSVPVGSEPGEGSARVEPAPGNPEGNRDEDGSGPAAAASAEEGLLEITSPMVGTFYRSPTPGADPFAPVGARVSVGDTLCIIEAMKLMNELEAEVEGTVREVCVENGEPVEYGQVLFRVEPD